MTLPNPTHYARNIVLAHGPLTGTRVLNLTTNVSGPTATMVLCDLGADVIKVERPGGGDDARHMGPYSAEWSAYFVPLNRGKRSLVADITRPEGRDLVLRLASRSDVFVENFRGGKAKALGFDEDAVRAVQPEIIYASLTAYGPRGPDHERSGYDAILQARTGIVSVTGADESSLARTGISTLDMGSGVWTALGVVAALLERTRSGRGQRVDSSLMQTGVMWMAYHLLYRQFTGFNPVPRGTRHTAFAPYATFRTADGSLMIGVSNDRLFARLAEALGRPEWPDDPRYRTNRDRIANRSELEARIAAILEQRPAAHWMEILNARGVPVSPIQTAGDVLNDPQLAALEQMEDLVLDGGRPARVPRLPLEMSLTPPRVCGPPPRPGEHTRTVLEEAGLDPASIEALLQSGIIEGV